MNPKEISMRKYPFVLVLLLVLCTVLTPPTSAVRESAVSSVQRLIWQDTGESGPRCRAFDFSEAGLWSIEQWTSQPSTAPGFVVVHTGLDAGPRFVERAEVQRLRVEEPGAHLVCLTSQASLGEVEVVTTRVAGIDAKDGDPDETEVELDP
jgi:hypothetical protein